MVTGLSVSTPPRPPRGRQAAMDAERHKGDKDDFSHPKTTETGEGEYVVSRQIRSLSRHYLWRPG
jgi:hypothetical protein